mmetsp:Transcript_9139/g.15994  ORF Transcript_9139/g.15994 Transcript_9139/m.15994 type:complete len:278 (+) Transcript_9139:446-1279(+)|eukprot:CAMPEP_0119106332 /NCGR_PEP_ID=MMETSP1180-20130426/4053_1 /TAXON_ID=3052 ORGANISM="Chlamydomonas cf sp, Strain CCMP681" /NCGR_SAMPLE_ID=MMETSP1180 /ASSEMBLY_ACC=CAM_ASM_000741 /LENGTH=277 /DNA_ID=CAMNT_0007091645 /DNA_START=454 /DNA_END=1287 /DNA_ORIENTATION=+
MGNPFLLYVCPAMGVTLGIIMLLSPFPAVLKIRKQKTLGEFNPLPLLMAVMNCIAWLAYGCICKNPWIPPGNTIGTIGGMYFVLEVLIVADRKTQDLMIGIFVGSTVYFVIFFLYTAYEMTHEAALKLWSYQAIGILLIYYVVPLSTMYKVVKTRNAVSFYLPLSIATIINGVMWGLYGYFGVNDLTIWMPNSVGGLLGLLQVILHLIYGSRPVDSALAPSGLKKKNSDCSMELRNLDDIIAHKGEEDTLGLLSKHHGSVDVIAILKSDVPGPTAFP